MNEAAELNKNSQDSLRFDLTGGEPFIDFARLVSIVDHGRQLGADVSCVTNGYWARSDEVAKSRLSTLREAGLTTLSISVSRFHQQFVPLERARRALTAAASVGLSTELKGAVTTLDLEPGGLLEQWKRELDADVINIFPVLPYLRQEASLPDSDYYRQPGLPAGPCPGEVLCIEPDGTALSCCLPGSSSDFLALGSVHDQPLHVLDDRFRASAKQKFLRQNGPIYFAKSAIESGLAHLLRNAYAGPCDLCLHIGTNPQLRSVADQISANVPI